MANVIKLRKGLDINLTGKASKDVTLQVAQAGSGVSSWKVARKTSRG